MLTMPAENKPHGQNRPCFSEAARLAQVIERAIETIATLGCARAFLKESIRIYS